MDVWESFLLWSTAPDSFAAGKGPCEDGGVDGSSEEELWRSGVDVDGSEEGTTPEKAPFSFSEDMYS
jgi:hypothetical protein